MDFRKIKGAAKNVMNFQIPDLAAGADITGRSLFQVPDGFVFEVESAWIVPHGDDAGIDANNTSVLTLKNGSNTVVSETFDGTTLWPNDEVFYNLGTLDTTYTTVDELAKVSLAVTNGTTANLPQFDVQVEGYFEKKPVV